MLLFEHQRPEWCVGIAVCCGVHWLACVFRCEVNHESTEMCYCNRDDRRKISTVSLLYSLLLLHFNNYLNDFPKLQFFCFSMWILPFAGSAWAKSELLYAAHFLFIEAARKKGLWWISILAGQQGPEAVDHITMPGHMFRILFYVLINVY